MQGFGLEGLDFPVSGLETRSKGVLRGFYVKGSVRGHGEGASLGLEY